MELTKLLSIQSHVSHGYVGNKAATFPLQCLGWDVDTINVVSFSNHTGYGTVAGTKLTSEELRDMFNKLEEIGITNQYQSLLTGYVPNAELLKEVLVIAKKLKQQNKGFLWLLDPVMGDEGVMYVEKSVVGAHKLNLASGLTDIITPNLFETGLLVGFKVETMEDVKKALKVFHDEMNVKYVIISSIKIDGRLYSINSSKANEDSFNTIEVSPVIDGYFTGVGDLFSALLMDKISKALMKKGIDSILTNEELNVCMKEVTEIMRKVLHTTHDLSRKAKLKAQQISGGVPVLDDGRINSKDMKYRELRVVECMQYYK